MKQSGRALRSGLSFVMCLLCFDLVGVAAATAVRQPVDESVLVALSGNMHPLAKPEYDEGAADPSLPTGRMLLVLKRSSAQEADFQQYLSQLRDKSSANYHKWLTPAQYADRFGSPQADVQTITSWLEANGFTVKSVSAGRTTVEFSGTIGQLQQTFHTSIHRYGVAGQEHLANASDPMIPAALNPVIAGLASMNDFFPAAPHTAPVRAGYDKPMHHASAETTTGGENLLYAGPSDAATIYDTPNAFNANFKGSKAYTGSGVTIAVVSDANVNPADVSSYRSFFGLPASALQVVIDGGNDPGVDAFSTGHTQQALMNLEVASALAPNANLMLYTAKSTTLTSGMYMAVSRALNDNLADIVEVGFTSCEAELAASGNSFFQQLWAQGAMQGVSVVVATGDGGGAGCDAAASDSDAQNGLNVNGIASTNYNIAVGGTDFDTLPGNFSGLVGGNGIALGYIPESPWNNSVAVGGNGGLAANAPFKDVSGATNIFASGGGASRCVDGAASATVCGAAVSRKNFGESKPPWQVWALGLNIPENGVRNLPDVALLAGSGQYGAAWAVCGNDYDATGNLIADCAPGSGSSAHLQGIGGTSAAASAFAGVLALVSQSQGSRLGQANYVLYGLASQPKLYAAIYHDIQGGNNSVVCAAGTPDCGPNGFLTGFNAGTGYDQATGLGSIDVSVLIANWKELPFASSTTTLTVNGSAGPISVAHGTPLSFTVAVAGKDGTPTGLAGVVANVDETSDTYGDDVGFAGNLTGGLLSEKATNAPGGTYDLTANYVGDLNFAASSSTPVQLIIAKEASTLRLDLYTKNASGAHQVTTANPSYPYGSYVSVEAIPAGLSRQGIATGTVTFQDNGTALATPAKNLNYRGFAEIPIYYWPGGSHSITASFGGDNSFDSSATTAATTFTISTATTGLTVSVTPGSILSGTATVTGTITPATASLGAAPSGTVTLTDTTSSAALGSATLAPGTSGGGAIASFTMTINASSLKAGANTLMAVYAGDKNYGGASGATTITVTPHIATLLALSPTPATLATGTTTINGQVTAAASGGAMPTGSVTLTDSSNGAVLGSVSLSAGSGSASMVMAGTFSLVVNASSLVVGTNSIAAAYTGDTTYAASSGSTTIVITRPPTPGSAFVIAGSNVTISTPATPATTTITVTPMNGFTGQVNLAATLVSSPSGALSMPVLSLSAASVTLNGSAPATVTGTITTTALKYALQQGGPRTPGRAPWYAAGGGVLACVLLFGIPARRRGWQAMLGLLLFAAVGMSVGCGVSLNPLVSSQTTPGTYVFMVAGVDQANGQLTSNATITVVVK